MEQTEIDSKFITLETKITYMEDFLQQLQDVTVKQSNMIDILQKENKLMAQKIQDISDAVEGEIPNRKPPHY